MVIRLAQSADVAAIMSLIKAVVPAMHAAGNFQWDYAYPNPEVFEKDILLKQLWVAVIGEQIAGVAAITTDQDPEYANIGWNINETAIVTHRLAVSPAHQGNGVAKALLQKAEEIARERGIAILRIDTNSKNAATQALFPKLGYQFSGKIGLHFRPGLQFFCYEKKISI